MVSRWADDLGVKFVAKLDKLARSVCWMRCGTGCEERGTQYIMQGIPARGRSQTKQKYPIRRTEHISSWDSLHRLQLNFLHSLWPREGQNPKLSTFKTLHLRGQGPGMWLFIPPLFSSRVRNSVKKKWLLYKYCTDGSTKNTEGREFYLFLILPHRSKLPTV